MQMCEQCGKKPANVHLTQISANGTVVSHLCEHCAKSKGISISIDTAQGDTVSAEVQQQASGEDKSCPRCGMKFSLFRERGRLGCRHCYRAFGDEIDRMLTEMHGSCVHRGKRYTRIGGVQGTEADIERLRGELDRAIRNEDFEEAARLRDTISALSPLE